MLDLSVMYCPHCGRHVNAATPIEKGTTPRVNDFTICAYCKQVSVFDELCLRKPDVREEAWFWNSEEGRRFSAIKPILP